MNIKTDLVTNQLDLCYHDLHVLFTSTITNFCISNVTPIQNQNSEPQDNHELSFRKDAIQELVFQVFNQKHTKKQLILLRIITKLVNNRIIEVRYVCEYMLNNLIFSNSSNSNTQYLSILNSSTNYINSNNSNFISNNNTISLSNNFGLIQKCTQQSYSISNSFEFKATPTYLWCKILECIRRFIPLHDYKSCRDIFKMLLEVVKKIPHSHSSYPIQLETELLLIKKESNHKLLNDYTSGDNSLNDEFANDTVNKNGQNINLSQDSIITDDLKLESLYETINFLLDKENYFMPRYLAINEIKTVLTFGKEPYHSRFHSLFTKFIESFIPTGHLISISGRDRLLPIVGFSNLYSLYSFWRFNQSTCKFNTSGPLPYYKVGNLNKSYLTFNLILLPI